MLSLLVARLLLVLLFLLVLLASMAHGTSKDMMTVSYHTCAGGEGCHLVGQVLFHDSHVMLLTSANDQDTFQGRIVRVSSICSLGDEPNNSTNSNVHFKSDIADGENSHQTIGFVRCGNCPLAVLLKKAVRTGVKGVIVANSDECGRPTHEFLEATSNIDIPVAFVASRVAKEIHVMEQLTRELRSNQSAAPEGAVHKDAFVYVSVLDRGASRSRSLILRAIASTHILLASMVVLTLMIYLMLACTVGSLRHIPREIVPELFGSRPEPVDKAVLDQLPLISVEWNTSTVDNINGAGKDNDDEEARYETPESELDPLEIENEILQQQLARIIQRVGRGSYSYTEERGCAICLSSYAQKDLLRLLPCKHAFHQSCIDAWLLSKDMTVHCPVCKSNINDGLALLKKYGYSKILELLRCTVPGDVASAIATATAIASDSMPPEVCKKAQQNSAETGAPPSTRFVLVAPFLYFYDVACKAMTRALLRNTASPEI